MAFELVPAFLGGGVRVEPHDHSGRQGAVDALLHYPDGRTGALEVTSHAPDGHQQRDKLLATKYQTLPNPGRWTWDASVGHPRDLPGLGQRVARIIALSERHEVQYPNEAYELRHDPDIAWLMTSSVELFGHPSVPKMDGERERPLYVMPAGGGGIVDETLQGFADAMNGVLAHPNVVRHAEKVVRHGADEAHLFIAITPDDEGDRFGVWYALMWRDVMPPAAPALPCGVTHLWLAVLWTPWVFLVTADGLQRHRRPDVQPT
jgi:hypothetical protein